MSNFIISCLVDKYITFDYLMTITEFSVNMNEFRINILRQCISYTLKEILNIYSSAKKKLK